MKNLFLTFLMLTGFSLLADDLYVNSSGLVNTYFTIQEAVDNANSGDNIFVSTVGTYSEDVTVDKSVFIVAGVADELFTLSGEFIIDNSSGSIDVTIIGMNNGSVTGNGEAYSKVTVNVISSLISSVDFSDDYNYDVHIYDCTVYNDCIIKNGQIKGSTLSELTVYNDVNSFNPTTDTIKIMGNNMTYLYYQNDQHYFEICNNLIYNEMVYNGSSDVWTNNMKMLEFPLRRTDAGGTNLIANNTIEGYMQDNGYCSNMTLWGITFEDWNSQGDGQNVVIVNNYISNNINSYCQNSYEDSYVIYSNPEMNNAYIANNHYYTPSQSNINYWTYNFDNSSVVDNVEGQLSFDSETGILTGGQDQGLDWIEYRDIDNTTNDIGTAGGPHAWSNYNTTQGKAAVIDLELPFQLYIGGVHNVKAKSFHKN
tara:strand:- start:287 stop:1558 length:1272 start_codon:yes stop_codon:yes gene_type:complete